MRFEKVKRVKSTYLKDKQSLLKDFGIIITDEISERLSTLYPNEIAIENYTRKLIREKLEKFY